MASLIPRAVAGVVLLGATTGLAFGQEDRFDSLANLPFEQNRPTEETAQTLLEELTLPPAYGPGCRSRSPGGHP